MYTLTQDFIEFLTEKNTVPTPILKMNALRYYKIFVAEKEGIDSTTPLVVMLLYSAILLLLNIYVETQCCFLADICNGLKNKQGAMCVWVCC